MPRLPMTNEAAAAAFDRYRAALDAWHAKQGTPRPTAEVICFPGRITEADRDCVVGGLNKLAETIDWLDDCLPKPLLAKLQAMHAEISNYLEDIS